MPVKASKPPLRLPPAPKGYKLFRIWIAAALRRIAAASGISLHIDGAESATIGPDGSMQFKISGLAPGALPLDVGPDGKVIPGTVMSVITGIANP